MRHQAAVLIAPPSEHLYAVVALLCSLSSFICIKKGIVLSNIYYGDAFHSITDTAIQMYFETEHSKVFFTQLINCKDSHIHV